MANRIKLAGTTANAFTIGLNGVTLDSSNASSAYTLVLPSTDGNANQVLSTNGSGNLNWVDVQAGTPNAIVNGNSNVTIDANSNVRVSVAGTPNTVIFTSSNTVFNTGSGGNITGANLIQANFFSGNGSLLTGLNASNVVGTVANAQYAQFAGTANTANTVAGANVTGTVANAAYALFAGTANTANSVQGSNVIGSVAQANFANTANAVAGANVTGIVADANYAAFSGNVVNSSQPNITSLGTLSSLDVTGNVTANYFIGNGFTLTAINGANIVGNISGNISNAAYADFAGTANTANVANSVSGANVVGSVAQANFANTANAVAGANVSGTVANAQYANFAGVAGSANAVAGANVTGIVADANYAAFSANVTGNAQPNITSVGTLTDLTVTGNVSANYFLGNGSQLTGIVTGTPNAIVNGNSNVTVDANSNVRVSVSGNANVAIFTGNGLVLGAGTGGNISNVNLISANLFSGNGALLTALNASNVVGTVANAQFANFAETANTANTVAGANVTGIVANANYAAFSGNVTVNAQPNITSVGTLTGLTVDGNVTANVYKLNLTAAQTANAGEMTWNASDGTMDLGMLNGVTQQVGQETYFYVKANAAITNGRVVMFDGVQGGTIKARHANTSAAGFKPSYVMGVATQDIALNDDGYITAFGRVSDLNTNAYPAGSLLYLTPNSDGNLQITEPAAPGPKILVAACLNQSNLPATNGRIFVRPELGLHMYDLHDVSSNNAVAGDVLVYNSSNIWATSNTVPTANVAYSVSGANVSGSVAQANFANTANAVSGANVSGQVGNALVAGTVYTAAQPNITSVGTLSSLDVSGTANLGQVANVKILGGSNAQVLSTDGTGNLNWVTATGGSGTPGGSNTNIQFNDAGAFGGSNAFVFDKTTNAITASGNFTAGNLFGNGAGLSSVTGANVTGTVANATFATTAGSATTAGTVTTNAQPNITSVGTLTSIIVSGTANLGNIANVKIFGGSNLQVIQTDGTGNLSFATPATGGGGDQLSPLLLMGG